jgi:hypothetical protein
MAATHPQRSFPILAKLAALLGWPSESPAAPAILVPEPAAEEPAGPASPFDALAGELRRHGAGLAPRGPEDARLLTGTGFFIGEHRDTVAPLLDLVLEGKAGAPIRLDLKQRPAAEVGVICQFGQALARLGLLAEYAYRRAPHYLLTARVRDCPDGRRFLAGGWFPYYARGAVLRRLGQPRPPHALDVRLSLPDGAAVELDLVALRDGRLWAARFGCDDLPGTLAELRHVAAVLPTLAPHPFLVLPRVAAPDLAPLKACFEVTVCDRECLDLLLAQLEAPPAPQPAPRPESARTVF